MTNTCELFFQSIKAMPIWVKQYLTKEVLEDLALRMSDFQELLQEKNLFQYLVPKITLKGKQEYQTHTYNLSDGHYVFLETLMGGAEKNVFEITLLNNWPLTDTAKMLLKLVELELISVENFATSSNIAVAMFLAGRIKTGELLKKLGKIDTNQLEQAIRYQKELNAEGRHIKMASILIKLGYITDKGLDSLLLLKDEAKKRFNFSVPSSVDNTQTAGMQRELARLEHENTIMKKRLKQLLNING